MPRTLSTKKWLSAKLERLRTMLLQAECVPDLLPCHRDTAEKFCIGASPTRQPRVSWLVSDSSIYSHGAYFPYAKATLAKQRTIEVRQAHPKLVLRQRL
jgi:hypothetical protein